MAAVRELALPIRKKYGVKLAGWYYSDVGELNQVVHIWWFQDHAHMEDAKAKIMPIPTGPRSTCHGCVDSSLPRP